MVVEQIASMDVNPNMAIVVRINVPPVIQAEDISRIQANIRMVVQAELDLYGLTNPIIVIPVFAEIGIELGSSSVDDILKSIPAEDIRKALKGLMPKGFFEGSEDVEDSESD